MIGSFEYKGEWFLPNKPDESFFGILKYDSKDGATLELFGLLSEKSIDIDLINGITTNSKEITLYKVFLHHRGGMTLVSQGETGKPTSLYTVNYILEGHRFQDAKDLQFNSIEAQIFNLDEWVGISGFKKLEVTEEQRRKYEFSLSYTLPKPIKFKINDSLDGMFNFIGNLPDRVIYQKEAIVKQEVELCLTPKASTDFLKMLDYLFIFQNFITLSIYEATYPTRIILKSNKALKEIDDGKQVHRKIKLYFSIRGRKSSDKIKYIPDMLYSYGRIKDDFERLISKWYSLRTTLEPVYNLLFDQFYHEGSVNENNFLNIAQAAEAMHATLYKGTKMPPAKYKEMKERILKLAPKKYHDWLNEQFNFGNNLNLHLRLTELIAKYGNKITDQLTGETEAKKQEFVKKVKDSRNYYTHYSSTGKKKALKSIDLFYLSQKLRGIVVSGYLEETGFSHEAVEKLMIEHKRYFIPFHL